MGAARWPSSAVRSLSELLRSVRLAAMSSFCGSKRHAPSRSTTKRGCRSKLGTGWPDSNATTPPGSSCKESVGARLACPGVGTRLHAAAANGSTSAPARTIARRNVGIIASKVLGHVCSDAQHLTRALRVAYVPDAQIEVTIATEVD